MSSTGSNGLTVFWRWLLLLSFLYTITNNCNTCLASSAAQQYQHGVTAQHVVALNKDNFNIAIRDPANSFWFLKFFAPWCGHCKKLAPVLEKVAPVTTGTMSIGTIDCTVEKKLCDQHKVRGYPTLKFSIDGEIYNYDGGRTEHDLIELSKKMLRPVIESVDSIETMKDLLVEKIETGVAFLFYDPTIPVKPEDVAWEKHIDTTPLGQLFAQVSRKLRASGSFFVLDSATTTSHDDIVSSMGLKTHGPFLCRMESNVAPRCYDKISDSISSSSLQQYLTWIETENVPTVSQLGAHNFHKLGRSGRPLAVAIINEQNKEQLDIAKSTMTQYAISGPTNIRDKYYYAYFDGNVWKNFLSQFEVYPQDIPQLLVLDVPIKSYYQNASFKLNIDDFLLAIEDGTIKAKISGPVGVDGHLISLYRLIIAYRPWSVMVIAVLLVSLMIVIFLCLRPSSELRPRKSELSAKVPLPPPTTTIDTPNTGSESANESDTKKEK